MDNQLKNSKQWHLRGKRYQAKTMDALQELYGTPSVKPGQDPKGIKRKDVANAQKSPAVHTPKA